MKLAIIGSRGIDDAGFIEQKLDEYAAQLRINSIVSGGAKGVDSIAEAWAKRNGIQTIILKPDYENYEPQIAPLLRNEDIVKACDLLVAFWDGKSRGTDYTVRAARKANKLFKIFVKHHKSGWVNW